MATGSPLKPPTTCAAASHVLSWTTPTGNRCRSRGIGRASLVSPLRTGRCFTGVASRWRRPAGVNGPGCLRRNLYQSDVWLDGSYLGDTEGYFFPHAFDVTSALGARPDHLLALEVVCDRPARRAANRALTGVFGRWGVRRPGLQPRWHLGAGEDRGEPGRPDVVIAGNVR